MEEEGEKIRECEKVAARYRARSEEEQQRKRIEYLCELGLTVQPTWKHRRKANEYRADEELINIGTLIDAGEDPRKFITRVTGPYAKQERELMD